MTEKPDDMPAYRGKRLDAMTREELIAALKVVGGKLLELQCERRYPRGRAA